MPTDINLCVLRLRHDTTAPVLSDAACLSFVDRNVERRAIGQYWSDVTGGFARLHFDLAPWQDIVLPAPTMEHPDTWKRATIATQVYDATTRAGVNLDRYQAFVVFVYPGTNGIDLGTTTSGALAGGRPFAVLPLQGTAFSTGCHEVGHAIGFYRHTYGVINDADDWDGSSTFLGMPEYGDPYDIMSGLTFGSRWRNPAVPHWFGSPTFAATTVAVPYRWPTYHLFDMCGPAVARANLWDWNRDALNGSVEIRTGGPSGWTGEYTVYTASKVSAANPSTANPTLIVLRPGTDSRPTAADPPGTHYLEFRTAEGWDQGLHTSGDDLAQQGIVMHRKADNGSDTEVIWYVGSIRVPVGLDPDLSNITGDFAVSVVEVAADHSWVRVAIALRDEAQVRVTMVDQRTHDVIVSVTPVAVDILCAQGIFDQRTHQVTRTSVFTAHSQGFGGTGQPQLPPVSLTWTIGGVDLDPTMTSGDVSFGDLRHLHHLVWTHDTAAAQLTVTNDPANGNYRVPITATVTDGTRTVSATRTLEVEGVYQDFPPEYYRNLRECADRLFWITHPQFLPIHWPGPDPAPILQRIQQRKGEAVAAMLSEATAPSPKVSPTESPAKSTRRARTISYVLIAAVAVLAAAAIIMVMR